MKKKNILFVMNKLVCGGAEKALISLLETIDYSRFNVDLFLFAHEGLFMAKIPEEVTVLPAPENYKYFDMPFQIALKELIKKGNLNIAFYRFILGLLAKTEKSGAAIEQRFWKYASRSMKNIPKEYDIAIGFLEKNPIYFCVDRVKAKKKIGWIHTDYRKLKVNFKKEQEYFKKLDHVVTVSEELVKILQNNFPQIKEKFTCLHNITSPQTIKSMASEKIRDFEFNSLSTNLVTVCRLAKEKGLDIALDAVQILVERGHEIEWVIVGEGSYRQELEQRIREWNLSDRIHLLGLKENPYPYIKNADIYLQTSRFEGKSISIDEAKILAKPILITNFDTASNHIIHNENGIISKMDAESVANDLELLIIEDGLRKKFSANLKVEKFGTEGEVEKLYRLIEC